MGERTGGNSAVPFLWQKKGEKEKRKCRKVTLLEARGCKLQRHPTMKVLQSGVKLEKHLKRVYVWERWGCSAVAAAGRQAGRAIGASERENCSASRGCSRPGISTV